jgi:hypothetical protein
MNQDRKSPDSKSGGKAEESMTSRTQGWEAKTVRDAQGTTYVVTPSGVRIRVANTGSLLGLRRARIDDDGRCFI